MNSETANVSAVASAAGKKDAGVAKKTAAKRNVGAKNISATKEETVKKVVKVSAAVSTSVGGVEKAKKKRKRVSKLTQRWSILRKRLNNQAKSCEKKFGSGVVRLRRSINGTVRVSVRPKSEGGKSQRKEKKDGVYKSKRGKLRAKTIHKKIGGEKNGVFRHVLVKKRPDYYPAVHRAYRRRIQRDRPHFTRKTPVVRHSLVPGRIVILLAGRHRGKRVVVLRVLKSGLLVITGPFRVNGCPMRRMHPEYVIATKTRLDMTGVRVPVRINNLYFKKNKKLIRKVKMVRNSKSRDIFKDEKPSQLPSLKKLMRKTNKQKRDQTKVDVRLIRAIRKRKDGKLMLKYLATRFGLKGTQYPHRMHF